MSEPVPTVHGTLRPDRRGEGTTPLPSPIAPQKCFPNTKSKLTAGGSGAEGRDGGDGKKSEGGELHGCDTVTARKRVD